MSEKPLERLNYHNGQRLEASDLKLEQEYHIRVRRWLNKSLYEPGIAAGLVVRKHPTKPLTVVVGPGLALDGDGREIILLEETEIDVPRRGRVNSKGVHEGIYLVIQYAEQVTTLASDGCTPRHDGKPASRLAWGGPARVLAEPRLSCSDVLPYESSGQIVLARVILNEKCDQVETIDPGVRRYVGAAAAAKVRQYALEGGREIDPNNPGKIYFHVRGRQPNAVTLYLRAEQFSTLYYTEMGQHKHPLDIKLQGNDGEHRHDIDKHETDFKDNHPHRIDTTFINIETAGVSILNAAIAVNPLLTALATSTRKQWKLVISPENRYSLPNVPDFDFPPLEQPTPEIFVEGEGGHKHEYGSYDGNIALTKNNDSNSKHTHNFQTAASIDAGVTDPNASNPDSSKRYYSGRSGAPLTYIQGLQVWIDGDNETGAILTQLQNAQPMEDWNNLDGQPGKPLHDKGTGEIKLDFLPGVTFDKPEHCIELRVPALKDDQGNPIPNGGRILYNLYVE